MTNLFDFFKNAKAQIITVDSITQFFVLEKAQIMTVLSISIGRHWGVKFEPISEFIFFTLFLFQMRGMVGFRAVKSGFILSSLRPVYPPYKSWVK